jgi:hypothetical protein
LRQRRQCSGGIGQLVRTGQGGHGQAGKFRFTHAEIPAVSKSFK